MSRSIRSKYIRATDAAQVISREFSIPIADLVDVFAKIPALDTDTETGSVRLPPAMLERVRISDASYTSKLSQLRAECIYGQEHFCDGRPNRSTEGGAMLRGKERCPNYTFCPIRQKALERR